MATDILIADDHALFREGLRSLIERDATFTVVADAQNVAETIQLAARLRPTIVILDLSMPGGGSVPAIARILDGSPATRILVVTMYDDPAFLRASLAAGAAGYVLKRSAHKTLLQALHAVRAGRMFVDPSVPVDSVPGPNQGGRARLTAREVEVMTLLARGMTYREAGLRLHVSVRTIETHRRNFAEKLGLRTRADVLRYALEQGLLAPGDVERDKA